MTETWRSNLDHDLDQPRAGDRFSGVASSLRREGHIQMLARDPLVLDPGEQGQVSA
jgi:hypothetical protein